MISTFSHVISTIPPSILTNLIPEKARQANGTAANIRHLAAMPATNVCVVNLYYDTPNLLQKIKPPGGMPLYNAGDGIRGFGYLIPNSVPFSQNPERALGVIFDSDIAPDLWTSVPKDHIGTRLTVMLGGHWWDGWQSFPSNAEAEEMARSVLARHLGITEKPRAVSPTMQRNCIPQYVVGHSQNMAEAHKGLLEIFGGRLRVAGSWYTGVGVNDCFRAAYDVVQGLGPNAMSRKGNPSLEGRTGLEKFYWGRPMVLVKAANPGQLEVVEVEALGKQMGYFANVREVSQDGDDDS